MSIIIFSRPIHSGKTTELLQWCNQQKNVCGILMPDINGSRKILDIKTKQLFDIECTDAENANELLTTIGKYNFYTAVFEKANLILITALTQKPNWLIVDEVGNLELEGKGFYDAIKKATDLYNKKNTGTLLITIRDSLFEEVIIFFKFKDYSVINSLEELDR
jgi:nucleoside-triphosphatase THEP1